MNQHIKMIIHHLGVEGEMISAVRNVKVISTSKTDMKYLAMVMHLLKTEMHPPIMIQLIIIK